MPLITVCSARMLVNAFEEKHLNEVSAEIEQAASQGKQRVYITALSIWALRELERAGYSTQTGLTGKGHWIIW